MRLLGPATILAALVSLVAPALGQWSVRKAGDLGVLVSRFDARGESLFFYCSVTEMGIGLVPTFPQTPTTGVRDLAKIRATLSIPGQPAVTLLFEDYEGGYWAYKGFTPAMARSVRAGSGSVSVTILPPEANALKNPDQSFDLAGIGAAIMQAKWPKRCR